MRVFPKGATRDSDTDKIDPEAALSPLVLQAYCEYIRKHRLQGSPEARGDDNWQRGIPPTSYMKSLLRHVVSAWKAYRGWPAEADLKDSLFAVMFNNMGLLHEILKTELEDHTNITQANLVEKLKLNCLTLAEAKLLSQTITPTEPKTIEPPVSREEWLEFQRNMTASSLPNEGDWSDLGLKELGDLADLQSDPKTS